MPDFYAEPYLHLAGLTHKSALVTWGAFYFKTKSNTDEFKLVDDGDLRHVFPPRRQSIGAVSESYGPAEVVVRDAAKAVWERLMDAVDPGLVDSVEQTARQVEGALAIHNVRIRWLGHNLEAELYADVDCNLPTAESHAIGEEIEHALLHALPQLERVIVHIDPVSPDGVDFHGTTAHHRAKS